MMIARCVGLNIYCAQKETPNKFLFIRGFFLAKQLNRLKTYLLVILVILNLFQDLSQLMINLNKDLDRSLR